MEQKQYVEPRVQVWELKPRRHLMQQSLVLPKGNAVNDWEENEEENITGTIDFNW